MSSKNNILQKHGCPQCYYPAKKIYLGTYFFVFSNSIKLKYQIRFSCITNKTSWIAMSQSLREFDQNLIWLLLYAFKSKIHLKMVLALPEFLTT